jgi:multidrug transporter EmrE-like cation transporter
LKGLRQLKIWSGICAVLLCFISGVFFLLPIQPFRDLATAVLNFGVVMFVLRDWRFLGTDEE